MSSQEIPVSFLCQQTRLYGILHRPDCPSARGVLLLAGRPALRSARHRLFVLLARTWAETGTPVMRFDYRGSGDSEGEMATLEQTDVEIAAAIDAFQSCMPGLQEVVLWGLCGGAADALLYAPKDARVTGIVLANPWLYDSPVRLLAALHRRGSMYLWKVRKSLRWMRGAGESISQAAGPSPSKPFGYADDPMLEPHFDTGPEVAVPIETSTVERVYRSYRMPDISRRLAQAMQAFPGRVLIILSGKDTGARAFKHAASLSPRWRRLLSSERVQIHELPEANHSLRRPEWRAAAASLTQDWLQTSV